MTSKAEKSLADFPSGKPPPVVDFDPLFGALMHDGWFPSPAHVFRRAAILDILGKQLRGSLVEMGCGAGRLLADWGKLGFWGEGVEPDAQSRAMAQSCVDAFDLPFDVHEAPSGKQYDFLIATEVLEHVEQPSEVLHTWLDSLKPGGFVLLTVPAFRKYWGASDEWAGHLQRFEPDDFARLMQNVGLVDVECRLYGYPIGNLIRRAGNRAAARALRERGTPADRQEATYASGRDRKAESRIAPIVSSLPGRTVLHLGIALQHRFNRGHGLLAVARKPAAI